MVRSKALEQLGIIQPKRRYVWFFSVAVLIVVVGAGIWGICALGSCISNLCSGLRYDVVSKDKGDWYICEHLAVKKVVEFDAETEESAGKIVATKRRYWYRLSIDENWYFKKFVPQVKKFLKKFAPDAEMQTAVLDISNLAYTRDGADKLQKGSCDLNEYDYPRIDWEPIQKQSAEWGKKISHDLKKNKGRKGIHFIVLIDEVRDSGASAHASIYVLDSQQFDKLQYWVGREVLRDRTKVTAEVIYNGTAQDQGWNARERSVNVDCKYGPVGFLHHNEYVITPWLHACHGSYCRRCDFVMLECSDASGITGDVEVKWSL